MPECSQEIIHHDADEYIVSYPILTPWRNGLKHSNSPSGMHDTGILISKDHADPEMFGQIRKIQIFESSTPAWGSVPGGYDFSGAAA